MTSTALSHNEMLTKVLICKYCLLKSINYIDRTKIKCLSFFWSSVYPAFKKAISRQNTKCAPIPVNLLSILSKIALYFIRLSNICFSYWSEQFHFSIMKAIFGTSSTIKELVIILSSSKKETSTVAWLFFVALLTYCLFVRTVNSFSTESHDDFVFPSFISEIRAYLPKQITISTISNLDPETIFINIAAYFDELSTFQARMLFKSVFVEYIGRLSEFICTCCSVSSSAQESGFGLSHTTQNSFLKPEDLCGSGYRVAGMLIRHCSMLLYSPVTTEGSVSSFEKLVNHFFLPRQLYETQDSNRFSTLNESNIFPCYVMESMQEQLPELTRGIAQLNWKSDPYLCRIIKDIVKIHYKHLGPGAIASMVLNSPTLDFRTHILQFATYDQIIYLTESKALSVSGCEQITYQRNILSNWVDFAYSIYSNTYSSGIYLSDAPFLVCPILLSNTLKDLTSALNSDSRKHSIHILKTYKEAVTSVACKETR
uniref:MMS22-like C-terminal domain-containing protein n=1 Tax=Schistosoma haematobium TaxID=6185 RepID=A0A095B3Y5_SCHHA